MPIRKGGVFFVKDSSLTMPHNDVRNVHPQRTVIVLSGDATNQDPDWPHVLVVPTSTSTTLKTEFCVKLAASVGNLPRRCWVRVVFPQPLLKEDLGDYLGHLPAEHVAMLEDNLFAYMGITD